MFSFVINNEYLRSELLSFVGSRQGQSGVIWGAKEPGCLIVTSGGRHSKRAGYSDKPVGGGAWEYFGQGEQGDHNLRQQANRLLVAGDRTVLLFTTREPSASEARERGHHKKRYKFVGAFQSDGHEIYIPENGIREGNKLLKFSLLPVRDGEVVDDIDEGEVAGNFSSLRQELIAEAPQGGRGKIGIVLHRKRSAKIRKYTHMRANGFCESCANRAPFKNSVGQPFLEVHHILRLADDGPDSVENVVALCPNCHRKAHFSVDREMFRHELVTGVKEIEARIAR